MIKFHLLSFFQKCNCVGHVEFQCGKTLARYESMAQFRFWILYLLSQKSYQFFFGPLPYCIGYYRLVTTPFTFCSNVKGRFNKINHNICIEFEVSSFWDSSAWKCIIQGPPGIKVFRMEYVFLIFFINHALAL
jgi:hypothetical protein